MGTELPDPAADGSLTRSTVQGIFWITASRVLKAPLNLIAVAVLARLLTPADFGIVAVGMLVVSLSDVIVDGSFGMVLIQKRQLSPALIGATLLLSAGLAAIFGLAVILGAPFVEREYDFPQLSQVLLVLGAVMPITAVITISSALLQRSMKFGALTLIAFVAQLTNTILAITLAVAGFGLWSLVWGQVAAFVVQALMGFAIVGTSHRLSISLRAVRDVLGTGGLFTLSKLLNWGSNSADRLIIGRLLGASELGFYTRAATLMRTARQLAGTGPLRVLFASFAKIQDDKPRMRKGFMRSLLVTLIVAALVSAFVIVNAEILVLLVLGPQWLPAVPLMQALFAAFIAKSGYVVAEAVPLSLGLGGQSALRQAAQLLLVIVGAAVGSRFGVVGAAAGVALGYWVFYLLCLVLVRRLLDLSWVDILKVHFNGVAAVSGPAMIALACQWLLPSDDIPSLLIPAVAFAIAALAVLALAPAGMLGEDLIRARMHARELTRRRFAAFRGRT